MTEENPIITIEINKNIEKALKDGYEEYLEKTEESALTVEEYNLHILKLGILSNEIDKQEIKLSNNKYEQSIIKRDLGHFENEYRKNRKKLNNLHSYE